MIKLNPDGKHNRRCPCEDCVTKRATRKLRASLPQDGSVCLGTTRCKCPDCTQKRKDYSKSYNQENKQILREKTIERNKPRQEEIAAYQKQYYQENKERLNEHAKVFREVHKDRISEQRAGYREQNRDILNDRQKDYYQNNRESRLEYAKHFRDEKMHPDYRIWDGIIQRCDNPNSHNYKYYGGRGISYDPKWRTFSGFHEDMGRRPEPSHLHSIERLNVNGNYTKDNCCWLPLRDQQKNTRRSVANKLSTPDDSAMYLNGELTTLKTFADHHNLPIEVARYRYCQHPMNADWVLNADYDNRYYHYRGYNFNLAELVLLSNVKYSTLFGRLRTLGWTVEQALGGED